MSDTLKLREELESALSSCIRQGEGPDLRLYEAMEYSLMAGGKRIRPVLLILTGLSLGADLKDLMPFACALEMIHTYSLIHDDLPAMDDDDYRRGRLTNHKVFGEAEAILAGDGLLNLAHELMAKTALEAGPERMVQALKALYYISHAAGPKGMIAGQSADLASEGKQISGEGLTYIEFNKTSRLLMAALCGGAYLAGASEEAVEKLEKAAGNTGLAFQIQDDLLDVEGTLEKLGKQPDSDQKSGKATFVSLYGLEEAKRQVNVLTEEALSYLAFLPGEEGDEVRALIRSLAERDH